MLTFYLNGTKVDSAGGALAVAAESDWRTVRVEKGAGPIRPTIFITDEMVSPPVAEDGDGAERLSSGSTRTAARQGL